MPEGVFNEEVRTQRSGDSDSVFVLRFGNRRHNGRSIAARRPLVSTNRGIVSTAIFAGMQGGEYEEIPQSYALVLKGNIRLLNQVNI